MYLKPETLVSEWSAVESFLSAHPLGLLTTCIPLSNQSTLQASHVPFHFIRPTTEPRGANTSSAGQSVCGTWNSSSSIDLGVLQCHLARSNPQAKALLSLTEPTEVLIVFSSPSNQKGYISPSWYTTTKPATAKSVPTWNYAELQIYGTLSITSPTTLSQIVRSLSDSHESRLEHNIGKHAWSVDDAPPRYIELLQNAIVGIHVNVTKVGMKLKMSRDKVHGDRQGVVAGLRDAGADEVADLVDKFGPLNKS